MLLLGLLLGSALAGEDPVVMRIMSVAYDTPDPFRKAKLPETVRTGKTTVTRPGHEPWEGISGRVVPRDGQTLQQAIAESRPFFDELKVCQGCTWVFDHPRGSGPSGVRDATAYLVHDPVVEVRASDIASARIEDRWVSIELTPAGQARLQEATAPLADTDVAFVVAGGVLSTGTLGDPVGAGSAVYPITTTWGDEAFGAEAVRQLTAK